jgi:hypothetical protein
MLTPVNRNVIIIFPKQLLLDWVNNIFPNKTEICPKPMEHDQGNVYMIPDCYNSDEAIEYLKENYISIFENELADWCEDENDWPEKLTWKLFTEWFHYSYQSVVMDMVDSTIEKIDYGEID